MSLRNLIRFCVPIQLDDDDDGNIEDNEQLANAIQESLKPELPPRNNYGNVFPPLPWERDLKSVHMESRHFRNDLYASQFQQSGSVETEGQSSSVAHKQSVTTHHLNTDPDAEKHVFDRITLNPQTINNELPESSFALLGNTRSIHEELPESSYARSPGTLTNAESDVPVSYRGYRSVVARTDELSYKKQRAFVGGSWSDSGEENDEKIQDETCLVAQALNEVCSESSYFSDKNSSIEDLDIDNENDKLYKMSLKIITQNKKLKAIRKSLENELKELKDKMFTLEKNKGVDLDCAKCHVYKIENEKLKDESTRLNKFKKSIHCLNEMLSNQKPSGDKFGLGFNSFKASSSGTKEIQFEKAQKKACSDGGQICDNQCKVTFSEHDSEITKDGKVICRGIRKKGLYVMKLGNKPKDQICLTTIDENSTLWHRRLGHANMRLIQSLASKDLVRNLPKLKFDQHFCDACKIGKQVHAGHKAKNVVSTTRCLELLHMDLFGPSAVWSYGGNCYTLVIVDDYSREFDNEVQFGEFCNANGITYNFSDPRTPQSNGVVERKNRTLQEMSRTMLNEQSLPQNFGVTP
ncbi:retrovirus-related pol polyprotein from transposon TNT 1-94 [Tanacetum coccineum]